MNSDLRGIEDAIAGSGIVPKNDYLRWARSGDLATQARAFHLSGNAWRRIVPEPTMDEQCDVMADYLLACVSVNPDPDGDDFLHSGFDAGYTLAAWLKHLGRIPNAVDVIPRVSRRLEDLYRAADSDGRNRIETGVLEHVLEAPGLRRHFEHWGQDPVLREAHGPALEWGLAHEDRDV